MSATGPCPLCNKVFPVEKLEAHANSCLDEQQHAADQQLAAQLDGSEAPDSSSDLTFKFERKPFISFTPTTDPAEEERQIKKLRDEEEARLALIRARPGAVPKRDPSSAAPAPSTSAPPTPPAAAAPKRPNVVFDAAASHGWAEQVRTEIQQRDEFVKSIIESRDANAAASGTPQPPTVSPAVQRLPPIVGPLFDATSQAQLRPSLPARFQNSKVFLLYSTKQHGISLNTFYARVKSTQATFLVIEDANHWVFGAYHSDFYKTAAKNYYGTGESFLFTLKPKLQVFEWSRLNDYFALTNDKQLAFGGGGAGFGLWLDSDFLHGSSKESATYHSMRFLCYLNKTLSSTVDFECLSLEVWGLRPYA